MIEYGPAKQIMDNPAHPYTELLMSSVPRVGDKWEKEIAMPDMEGKEYAVEYCKFAPRCPYATDECRQKRPDATDMQWPYGTLLSPSVSADKGSIR